MMGGPRAAHFHKKQRKGMEMISRMIAAATMCAVACTGGAYAQESDAEIAAGLDEYRQLLADGISPGELFEVDGQAIWETPAGPKNASLEECDLGLGPGVVEGAYAQLPRYFEDTGRVMDAEARILHCMETLQGIDPQPYKDGGWRSAEKAHMIALASFVSSMSRDYVVDVKLDNEAERKSFQLGERLFYFQAGPFDFSCATCHSGDGMRIRRTDLPNITTDEGAAVGWTSWPAYRVSNATMWSMQRRINDCFRQQRLPEPIYASDATIALSMFMAHKSDGFTMATTGIKR